MKALLFAVGVVGLAGLFSWSEPTYVSAKPVTSEDVRMVREQTPNPSELQPNGAKKRLTRCSHCRG